MRRLLQWWIYLLPLLLAALTLLACAYLVRVMGWNIADFYGKTMRGGLFAGFLSLGSFLLSLKVGIVIKIKEALFDSPAYKQHLAQQAAINQSLSAYGPLRRLSRLLSVSVFSALICATLQMTLGLIPHWLATALCLASATFAMALLITSFILIQMNLSDWFDFIEKTDNLPGGANIDADEGTG
jgi:hypothetical protein